MSEGFAINYYFPIIFRMNASNISYLTDENGNKNSVVLPMQIFENNSFEDVYDVVLAENRLENDEFIEFA